MVTLLFAGLLVAAVVLDLVVIRPLERTRRTQADDEHHRTVELVVPRSLFFHPGHVWVRLEPDGQATVGVDDLLQTVLGGRAAASLPRVGDRLAAGDEAASLLHDGAELLLPAPVGGRVTAVHNNFGRDPASLRSRPYRDGWLYRLQPGDSLAADLAALKVGPAATAWMERETERLRELYADDVLQGPIEGVLSRAGEATWRTFDERFLAAGRVPHPAEV